MTGPVRQAQSGRSRGFLSLEAAFGTTLLLLVVLTLLGFGRRLLTQVRLEDEASTVAQLVARMPARAGSEWNGPLGGGSHQVLVRWGQQVVWVRVEAAEGGQAAERAVPRHAPWDSAPGQRRLRRSE